MHDPRLKHVIVVGGGLAGLAAAEALALPLERVATAAQPACTVTLVEPTGRLGGVVATVRQDGWLVERSADSFFAGRPEAIAMVERLGLRSELVGVDPRVRRALIYRDGRLFPVPAGFRLLAPGRISSIVTSPLLSLRGKLRLLAERFVPRRTADLATVSSDESLEQFAVRRLGREAFERLVQPLVSGIWTADPAQLSMAAACPEFFEMERRFGSLSSGERMRLKHTGGEDEATGARYGQFVTLKSGMETLPTVLGERLHCAGVRRITARAHRLVQTESGWELFLQAVGNGSHAAEVPPQSLLCDAVVLAVPSGVAAQLLAAVDQPLAQELAGIQYAGSAIVSLGFSQSDVHHPLDAAGLVVARTAGRKILAISFSSSKFPARAPLGAVLLRAFVGGALDPTTALLDDSRLQSLVIAEVSALLGIRVPPQFVQIDRWAGAMPQYHVGHVQRIERINRRLAGIAGVALAGAAYEGVGIPQVIASGQAAAARLV